MSLAKVPANTTKAPNTPSAPPLQDGDLCSVVAGTHAGKSGTVRDSKVSKTGHTTITVVQADGVRFKTLARHAVRLQP